MELTAEQVGMPEKREKSNEDDVQNDESRGGNEGGAESAKNSSTKRTFSRTGSIKNGTSENPAKDSTRTHPEKSKDSEIGSAFIETIRGGSEKFGEGSD